MTENVVESSIDFVNTACCLQRHVLPRQLPMVSLTASISTSRPSSLSAENVDAVLTRLRRDGAICFRDTGVTSASDLQAFLAPLVSGHYMPYFGGTNARRALATSSGSDGGGDDESGSSCDAGGDGGSAAVEAVLDTGTEPHHLRLREHAEMAYVDRWPGIIAFGCLTPPDRPHEQGQTTVVRTAEIVAALPTAFVERLRRDGLRHRFWYHDANAKAGDGSPRAVKSWQDAFLTRQPREVEVLCADRGWDYEWSSSSSKGITVSYVRDAFIRHPHTSEEVLFVTDLSGQWYDGWEPFCRLSDALRPYSFSWGDEARSVFSAQDRATWCSAVDGVRYLHAWQRGDVLLCDNMLAMHGRLPYDGGPRALGVLLAHPVDRVDVAL